VAPNSGGTHQSSRDSAAGTCAYSSKINGEDPDTSGPNLLAALKQQLGLELKAQKGPVEVIVVDHAETLEEN
jgi:uncharacterized protein (TIGR03435 family)